MQNLSDSTSDFPGLPLWFARLAICPLLKDGKIKLSQIEWLQPEDDIFSVGGHFELFAYIVDYL